MTTAKHRLPISNSITRRLVLAAVKAMCEGHWREAAAAVERLALAVHGHITPEAQRAVRRIESGRFVERCPLMMLGGGL